MTTSSDDLIGLDRGDTDPSGRDRRTVEVAELRRQLRAERERVLNATDRVLGAQAEAAQARAQIKELEYAIHVRDTELAQLKELLDQSPEPAGSPLRRFRRVAIERTVPALASIRQRLGAPRR